MAYWLIKTEPGTWSWSMQKEQKTTHWDGVRNYQAARNLKTMALGDLAFFYHSVKEKRIVGIVEIIKTYYPDFTDETGRFGMVDVIYKADLPQAVTLQSIKDHPLLHHLPLIRQSRLSVMPIDPESWKEICRMGYYDHV